MLGEITQNSLRRAALLAMPVFQVTFRQRLSQQISRTVTRIDTTRRRGGWVGLIAGTS
jgi:hypothetical protein